MVAHQYDNYSLLVTYNVTRNRNMTSEDEGVRINPTAKVITGVELVARHAKISLKVSGIK
jgi:hypothetical protein